MNFDENNQYSVLSKLYKWHWFSMLKFEILSLIGREIFSNKQKDPKKSTLLHLGSGHNIYPDFINADFYDYKSLKLLRKTPIDRELDLRYVLKVPNDFWEGVFTEHTLEHLTHSQVLFLFKELYRTMKTGAVLRICVPGLDQTLEAFEASASPKSEFRMNYPYTNRAEAVWSLTQNWLHLSEWDYDLMAHFLK